jgi:hypothetical protein
MDNKNGRQCGGHFHFHVAQAMLSALVLIAVDKGVADSRLEHERVSRPGA